MSTPIGASTQTVPSDAPSEAARSAPSSSQGLSNVPSTMTCGSERGQVFEFCQWISRVIDGFFNYIKSLFGSANSVVSSVIENTGTSAISSVENAETRLNNRIEEGTEIINSHFNDPSLDELNSDHSAIVVILKYQNELLTHYGRIPAAGHERDEFKDEVVIKFRRLLSEGANRNCEDGRLAVETIVLKKSNHPDSATSGSQTRARYDYASRNSWIQFSSGRSGSGNGSSDNANARNIANLLRSAIPANDFHSATQTLREIGNFIFNQL
jgi:hypothetical protein